MLSIPEILFLATGCTFEAEAEATIYQLSWDDVLCLLTSNNEKANGLFFNYNLFFSGSIAASELSRVLSGWTWKRTANSTISSEIVINVFLFFQMQLR